MTHYFDERLLLFLTGFAFLFLSIFSHALQKERTSIILLLCAALFFFLFAARFYPFINVWDERFHALVAKNLMKHSLMPTLYDDPVVSMAYDSWERSHIWLTKQPFFLWQIALSFALFGVNEFALRLPSVILSTFLVFAAYRSGKILGNENIGYYTAFLTGTTYYLMSLISGKQPVDHNDVSFLTYISLSLWAWIEYTNGRKARWIFLTGLASGLAVLCKWVPGLLVYCAWGVSALLVNKRDVRKYQDVGLSALVTCLVALPWQLFILYRYPAEAKFEYQNFGRHFTAVIQGHAGPFTYHFTRIGHLYGSLVPILILPAFLIFYKKAKDKNVAAGLILCTSFVYLFFSFAQTKMPSFTMIVILPVFLAVAFLVDAFRRAVETLKLSPWLSKAALIITLSVIGLMRFNVRAWREEHCFLRSPNRSILSLEHNKQVFQNLRLPENAVIFNVPDRHYIEAMFYSGHSAYSFIPSYEQYSDLKSKKRIVAMFKPADGEIPPYLKEDPSAIFINEVIQQSE